MAAKEMGTFISKVLRTYTASTTQQTTVEDGEMSGLLR
jgi:hypothetical protein